MVLPELADEGALAGRAMAIDEDDLRVRERRFDAGLAKLGCMDEIYPLNG